jgi:FG-GAP repeat
VAALPFDFNGDRYVDLAIGTPFAAVGAIGRAGAVNVLYGSDGGLILEGNQLWNQDAEGVLGDSQLGDHFGSAIASGDFNRDGYADLAIGTPQDDPSSIGVGGAVNVLYGTSSGLDSAGNQLWTREELSAEWLGTALASGDFDADGFADLAIGGGKLVVILPGTASGLTDVGATTLSRGLVGAPLDPYDQDSFGIALAAGDLNDDGRDDLAVSSGTSDGGDVAVFNGGVDGLTTVPGDPPWSQDSAGVQGTAYSNDQFGHDLAIGDFDADGFGDLAVGVPGEADDSGCASECSNVGAVNVLYGSATGLDAADNQLWTQASPGVPGTPELWDRFGRALAAGDFDGDGTDDLAIGAPGEDSTDQSRPYGPGAVTILYGTNAGLATTDARRWAQDSPGVPGTPGRGDWFGRGIVSGDFDQSGFDDLAIAVPREKVNGAPRAGEVDVLYGQTAGLSSDNAQAWSGARGLLGGFEHYYFGMVLGTGTALP